MVFPRFLLASYTRCIKINLLNAILQHASAVISISQLGSWDADRINNLPKVAQAIHKREREKKNNKCVRILGQNPHQWTVPSCRWNELEKKVSSTSLATPGWVRVQSKEAGKCVAVYLEGICTNKTAESGKLSIFPCDCCCFIFWSWWEQPFWFLMELVKHPNIS